MLLRETAIGSVPINGIAALGLALILRRLLEIEARWCASEADCNDFAGPLWSDDSPVCSAVEAEEEIAGGIECEGAGPRA